VTRLIPETVERIGVCRSKSLRYAALFKRLRVKLSRKYRVWPVAGDDRFIELDPYEFTTKFEIVEAYKPEG
jgi:hypothetical protein